MLIRSRTIAVFLLAAFAATALTLRTVDQGRVAARAAATTRTTTGSNGNRAAIGYDLVKGRGSPKANLVVNDLVGSSAKTAVTSTSTTFTGTAGQSLAVGRFSEAERFDNELTTVAIDLPDLSVADPIDLRPGAIIWNGIGEGSVRLGRRLPQMDY